MVVGCSEIIDALCNMHLIDPFDCFDLDDQTLVYKKVCNIFPNDLSSVKNIHRVLLGNMEPC